MAKQKQSHHQKSHNLQAANKIRKQTVAQGQFNRAMAVFNSHGLLPRHKKEAALLLRAAADDGFAPAQNELAKLHLKGTCGVEKSKKHAFSLFATAASRSKYVQAQFNLADCYRDGIGCNRNINKMVLYYRAAAKGGHPEAQYNLAICYRDGLGVPKSNERTIELYAQAAEQGVASAQFNLAVLHIRGEVTGKRKQDKEKDYAAAVPLLSAASRGDHAIATYCLADAYRHGQMGVDKNEKKALQMYRHAAHLGFEKATMLLKDWPPWKI